MDSNLLASLASAITDVQSLTGETITFGNTDCVCTAASGLSSGLSYEFGGAPADIHGSVCVLKSILSTKPAVDAPCSFRGLALRVQSVDDMSTQWQIHLIQQLS